MPLAPPQLLPDPFQDIGNKDSHQNNVFATSVEVACHSPKTNVPHERITKLRYKSHENMVEDFVELLNLIRSYRIPLTLVKFRANRIAC